MFLFKKQKDPLNKISMDANHTFVVGPAGTGKTHFIMNPIMTKTITETNKRVICFDPKGKLAQHTLSLFELNSRRKYIYFNPVMEGCPYFNPLRGKSSDVIDNLLNSLLYDFLHDEKIKQYSKDVCVYLTHSSVKVLKALHNNDVSLLDLHKFVSDKTYGLSEINELKETGYDDNLKDSIVFLEEYFKVNSNHYEHSYYLREQLKNLVNSEIFSKTLNISNYPSTKQVNYLDFDELRNSDVSIIMDIGHIGNLRLRKLFGRLLLSAYINSFHFSGECNQATISLIEEFSEYVYDLDFVLYPKQNNIKCFLTAYSLDSIDCNIPKRSYLSNNIAETVLNLHNQIIFLSEVPRIFGKSLFLSQVEHVKDYDFINHPYLRLGEALIFQPINSKQLRDIKVINIIK